MRYKKKFKAVKKILDEEFKEMPKKLGVCYIIWARKKQLLKEMFGIDWKTPAELNREISFD